MAATRHMDRQPRIDGADPILGPGEHSRADLIAAGLEAALSLRAPALQSSTPMVRRLSVQISRRVGLGDRDQRLVDLSARVRDIGMLGLPDEVILAAGTLSPEQWESVNHHPVLGAELLERIPGMQFVAAVVRAHHERWDGGGYPDGVAGEAIPLLSRVIATADAFVSLASDRPHRRAASSDAAIEHIARERGSHFDPRTVDALLHVLAGPGSSWARRRRAGRPVARVATPARGRAPRAEVGLGSALRAFDDLPAFEPACEKALVAARADHAGAGGDLVSAIEGDTGLTVAVLRRAQTAGARRAIANVPDAVSALGREQVEAVIESVPRVAFPWRTAQEALMYELRVHGQAVARAGDRIAQEVGFRARDDLIGAALLHDVGKLALARAVADDARRADPRTTSPEQRVREERRRLNIDHPTLGALLAKRWGLPPRLTRAFASHHTSDGEAHLTTLLRLADMVVRHAHGDTVDRRIMLRLASQCELPVHALRDVLFDLPQPGSQRRRAEPSPLSRRETDTLRLLATGKVYKEIGTALGISASTVRTHLHSSYAKLNVEDRAQAVLRATEMGWI